MSDHDVLYRWPSSAAFERTIPKTTLYERGHVRAALRDRFVDDVQRIVWAFKLSDDTIRLRGTTEVPEIQVFVVTAKGQDVADDVLSAIDRAVHFPLIFEIVSGDRVRTVGAHKALGGRTPRVGDYHSSGWQPTDAPRRPLPHALDLPGLYDAILSALLPAPVRDGETIPAATERLRHARKLQREIAALERRLRNEPQLNRQIELRRQTRERHASLAELMNPPSSSKE